MAETDYLALLAAKTVECHICLGTGILKFHYPDPEVRDYTCIICKGSGRVLDPRFKRLRAEYCTHLTYGPPCDCAELGYTVVRDLGVLLEVLVENKYRPHLYFSGVLNKWECQLHVDKGWSEAKYADTPLEAAAHAVYDWVETQEQEVTG